MSRISDQSGLGKRLLRVAVIADTHLTEADSVCNSPFAVNKLANDRLRYVIACLNDLAVDFCIHLGDLVHPVPAVPALFEQAAQNFLQQIAQLKCEILLVPGNHDVGDKPIDWGPSGVICEKHLTLWEQYFSVHYQGRLVAGCHFITLNAQLLNTGFSAEQAQRRWLERYLKKYQGGRFFINLHYPPYLYAANEREHYDNLGEPGRGWLLNLLEHYQVEALFAGHVHHFWTYRHRLTDCYLLPSTAFVRQDYSEMFQAAPKSNSEYGRNDRHKLGFVLLEVYQQGHLCRPIRTEGNLLTADWQSMAKPASLRLPFPAHPRQGDLPPLGFDMRKNWLTAIEIPPSGGLDEFDRKQVRNDYPIMALWEMGIAQVRIPRSDLDSLESVERLYGLYDQGMRLTLFSYDLPDKALIAQIQQHQGLLAGWEIAITLDKIEQLQSWLQAVDDLPIYLSKLHDQQDVQKHSQTYYHVINHGFSVEDSDYLAQLHRMGKDRSFAGYVFRIGRQMALSETAIAIDDWVQQWGKRASLHIRLSGENPAQAHLDETWVARRISEAACCAHGLSSSSIYLDTLTDVDRGYFPRTGVLDPLFNPRQGFYVLRNLNALLQAHRWRIQPLIDDQYPLPFLQNADGEQSVMLSFGELPFCTPEGGTLVEVYDLVEGHPLPYKPLNKDTDTLTLPDPGHPLLLWFSRC